MWFQCALQLRRFREGSVRRSVQDALVGQMLEFDFFSRHRLSSAGHAHQSELELEFDSMKLRAPVGSDSDCERARAVNFCRPGFMLAGQGQSRFHCFIIPQLTSSVIEFF